MSGAVDNGTALVASGDGGWSWFGDPRASHYNGKTYFGTIASDGDVLAHVYDHVGASVSTTTLRAAMEVDDHDNPSVLIRDSDKKLLYFYCRHAGGTNTQMYLRVSSAAESIASFAAEVDLDSQLGGTLYTYPTPFQLLAETNDPIYLFYRNVPSGTTENLCFSKSTDGGATWAAQTTLFTPGTNIRSYRKICSDGQGRIDFAVTDAHPYDGATSLYHFYYEGGNYYQSDGTQILSALPLTISDFTLVYDGSTERCWVFDIAYEAGTGNPIISFPTFPSTSAHRYRYARWDGAAWDVTTVVNDAGGSISSAGNPGEEYYSGCMALDPTDPATMYASQKIGTAWEIREYNTADNGVTFDLVRAVTSGNNTTKNIRPFVPLNRATTLPVIWSSGTYANYFAWTLGTRGYVPA